MSFKTFRTDVINHFNKMAADVNVLFESDIDKDVIWRVYFNAVSKIKNYPENQPFNCSCCKKFLQKYGGIISIKNGNVSTIWDVETNEEFQPVANALSNYVKSKHIKGFFLTKEENLGVYCNYSSTEDKKLNQVIEYHHFYLHVPKHLIFRKNPNICEAKIELLSSVKCFQNYMESGSASDLFWIISSMYSKHPSEEETNIIKAKLDGYAVNYKKFPSKSRDKECFVFENTYNLIIFLTNLASK